MISLFWSFFFSAEKRKINLLILDFFLKNLITESGFFLCFFMSFRLQAYQRQVQDLLPYTKEPCFFQCTVRVHAKTRSSLTYCVRSLEHQGGVLGLSLCESFSSHSLHTHALLRGPFVHKKSQEKWQDHTYTQTLSFILPGETNVQVFQEVLMGSLDIPGNGVELSFSIVSPTPLSTV